ncbi:MAG: alanine--tRNA ligase [Bacillota bacterium]|jgi:alanyl-tRNA synthetase
MSQRLGKLMSSKEIRSSFLEFFRERGHTVVPSSSLVPYGDPTLLFTNAGMVQFKDVFLGVEKRSYQRAVSSQKCVRAGGKHNDLDNVGFTGRHHTFFEMLGNFSFGDYFKAEAISFGWDYLTNVLELPRDRLWVTVYRDDDEAVRLWQEIASMPPERIVRLGEEDNFWAMGDTGPCGPCSEIVVDRGEDVSCGPGCGLGQCDCDRWLEVWNLVFMQYMRHEDGSIVPLPKPSIDTGLGLERVASVLQGADTNYGSDLFVPIIEKIEDICHKRQGRDAPVFPFRVIADHIRACVFLASDGVQPSNEGRGYVMRRILRRAVRFGRVLGISEPFLGLLVPVVRDIMGNAYPEVCHNENYIAELLSQEETRFHISLDEGQRHADEIMTMTKSQGLTSVSGRDAFILYDTYGFPIDLTKDMAREKGLSVDEAGFLEQMALQRERSRKNRKDDFGDASSLWDLTRDLPPTTFTGYHSQSHEALILAIVSNGSLVREALTDTEALVILDKTPFYATSGGQECDTGDLRVLPSSRDSLARVASVLEVQKAPSGVIVHKVKVVGQGIKVGQKVIAWVDPERRRGLRQHHTATHLIHRALRHVLGDHAQQSGSLVQDSRLRFDFSHFSPLSDEEILRVEDMVNDIIMQDLPVTAAEMSLDDAKKTDATALFGEKYGEMVRVVNVGDYSKELCGGMHVPRTGEIGQVQITSQGSVAAGIRRLEAVAGRAALIRQREQGATLSAVSERLGVEPHNLLGKVDSILAAMSDLERQVASMKKGKLGELAERLLTRALTVDKAGNRKVVSYRQDSLEVNELRELGDLLKNGGCSVVILGSVRDGRSFLLVMVSEEEAARGVDAVTIVRKGASSLGGSGGGKRHMAQAGGRHPEKINESMQEAVSEAVRLLVEAYGESDS